MKSIWTGTLSLPLALLAWWVASGDRSEAEAPEAPLIVQAGSPAWMLLANEFDGAPGDLSTIRTDLVATPSRLQLGALLGGSPPTAVFTIEASQSVPFLQARSTTGALEDSPAITRIDGRSFRIEVRVAEGLALGTYTGHVELKSCLDETCLSEVQRGTHYVPFEVVIGDPADVALGEWETFQRDAGHSGYVPATFQPRSFTYKWEWRRPTAGNGSYINAVSTAPGLVFVSDDEYFGSPSLRALRESDGGVVWQQTFANYPALNPPAAANGKVYVATTGHEKTFLWAFDATTGTPVFQNSFAGQWPHLLAPTIRDGRVYTNGGYFGGGVYAFHATQGDLQWSMFSGDDDMSTPAVDESRAYYYDGTALVTYDVATGLKLSSTNDPYSPEWGYSHHGAPMLGRADSVTTFSGGSFNGGASSIQLSDARRLINFSVANNAVRWRTTRAYITQPATAKGIVYAGSNAPKSFDAIDEATGQVLWSWVPPPSDLSFNRNVVVTDNLVFVSTDQAIYAIDLATRQPVWSYPTPGMMAISGGGTLYIVEGASAPTGRLIAFALK